MRIAMWSGPRNLSTALMYSFAARGDCAVVDEPFYGAYLHATGIDHPMRDAVISSQSRDPAQVAAQCLGPIPAGQSLFYQKQMTMHMIPEFDRGFIKGLTNVFLIRHPARVIASYARKREAPTLADIGFVQQAELYDQVADMTGTAPIVVDSSDIRRAPRETLARLCSALGIPFTENMLHWPAGPKPYDGIWAPHWYDEVWKSTGFGAAEGELPVLSGEFEELCAAALPYFERLHRHCI
ncbi:MAG: HAD family hydrolase [Cypionkella sp.]|nr:HAD family hydrolase [Cypionkella sp.]